MAHEIDFAPIIKNPHLQTILGVFPGRFGLEPPSRQKLVLLPDGDQLSLQITTPKTWKHTDLTVLLIHGLGGSHRSTDIVRIAKRFASKGIRAVRMNQRGCGSGRGLAKQFYHGGKSEDIFHVLKDLRGQDPDSPIVLIGLSLGANIVLKLAGELADTAKTFLIKVIALSPPVDLYDSVRLFEKPENALYQRLFYNKLRHHVLDHYHDFNKEPPMVPKKMKMIEFDDQFTAPLCGFASALDYYSKCSSAPYVPKIALPCKILFAKDDPFISHTSLDSLPLPTNVQVFKTKWGGHLGYLGNPFHPPGFRWLDSLLLSWTLEV